MAMIIIIAIILFIILAIGAIAMGVREDSKKRTK